MNNTADSHPMHMHLVQFKLVHRRNMGAVVPAEGARVNAWERGWKDTVSVHPGQVTRVRVKFDLPTVLPPVDLAAPAGFKPYVAATATTPAIPGGTSPSYNLGAGSPSGASCTTATSSSTRRTT